MSNSVTLISGYNYLIFGNGTEPKFVPTDPRKNFGTPPPPPDRGTYYTDYSTLRDETEEDFIHVDGMCVPISETVNIGWGENDETKIIPKALWDELVMWIEDGQNVQGS